MDPVTISMLVSAGVSAVQAYNANADQKQAQRDAQRLGAQLRATQEADKVSGLQVPTLGAELARQSLGQQMAMTVNALTGAGAAGVLGGIPGASAMGANAALEIAADLQRQQAARDQFVAAAQQDIEGRRVKAEREMIGDQLMGAQMQAYTSGTEKNQAIATGVGALGNAAAAEIGDQPLFKKDGFKVKDTEFGPTEPITPSLTGGMTELNLPKTKAPANNEQKMIEDKRKMMGDYGLGYEIAPAGVITPSQAIQFNSQSKL
jgi:hypothetical protein